MPPKRYFTAQEAAEALDISVTTLYAYVSRGLIRSEQSAEGKRQRRYYAEDIEKLRARKEGRYSPEQMAQDALHWGTPVMDSAITLIDGGRLYYRGHDIVELATQNTVEEVAALIWMGDMQQADTLFYNDQMTISIQNYEEILLYINMNGGDLMPIQELQACLPLAASEDHMAYDLRIPSVANAGARIIRLLVSIAAGEVPGDLSLSEMLQKGWCPDHPQTAQIFNAALILLADHELNASSFTARVIASAAATPYSVVLGGLAALQGAKHGGYIERINAMFMEVSANNSIRDVMASRLRRGDAIPGFGHKLYPDGDPRARFIMDMLHVHYPDSPELPFITATINAAQELIGEYPGVDTALVFLARVLELPAHSALTLFALGRTIGWIGHAIEQYENDRMIRPRARYIGEHP